MNCKFCNRKLRIDNKIGACHPKLQQKGLCAPYELCFVCQVPLNRHNKIGVCRTHRGQSEKMKAYQGEQRLQNKESRKQYDIDHRNAYKPQRNARTAFRLKTDTNFKLASNIRTRLTRALRGKIKVGSAIEDIGCSVEFLRQYLENQFEPGMTWENWSPKGWHIDHIFPLSRADLTDLEQFKKVCHYTNLRPLWAEANMKKGNRI